MNATSFFIVYDILVSCSKSAAMHSNFIKLLNTNDTIECAYYQTPSPAILAFPKRSPFAHSISRTKTLLPVRHPVILTDYYQAIRCLRLPMPVA